MPFIQNLLEKSKNLQFNRSIGAKRGHEVQLKTLKKLIQKAQFTEFGKAHNFEQILDSENPHERFKQAIAAGDYLHDHCQKCCHGL